jgi:3'-phosphoadenosine 5'-phosphosulfate sulfotransferase (PAPS reductase)/FAD synthetase
MPNKRFHHMPLQGLIDETLQLLTTELAKYQSPVLAWSGGKDSMSLLHLLYSHGIRLPIIYYEDPWFPRKNDFAHAIMSDWNLEVHNYPPVRVSLKTAKEIVALVSEYSSGPNSTIAVLKNTSEFQEGDDPNDFLCGVRFLMRPCGTFNFPWDVMLVGHRDDDTDQIFGAIPLHSHIVYRDEGPDFFFPLKKWTVVEVWDYTLDHKVPFQADRYDIANRKEWPNKTWNSDWYPTCIRCVDKRIHGQTVFCPKMNREITNVSGAAAEFGWVPDYFGEKQ